MQYSQCPSRNDIQAPQYDLSYRAQILLHVQQMVFLAQDSLELHLQCLIEATIYSPYNFT